MTIGKRLMALLAALGMFGLAALGPTACNTAEGFGEDLESAGEGLQEEVREEDVDDDEFE